MNKSPFNKNPFTTLDKVVLVPTPPPIETHMQRTPLRSYLSRPGDGLGAMLDSLGGSTRRPKNVEIIKRIPVPAVPEVSEAEES